MPSRWIDLVQSCSESSTDEVYDLATSWIDDTNKCSHYSPSIEEVSGVF